MESVPTLPSLHDNRHLRTCIGARYQLWRNCGPLSLVSLALDCFMIYYNIIFSIHIHSFQIRSAEENRQQGIHVMTLETHGHDIARFGRTNPYTRFFCWMPKSLPPRNQCTCWFAPTPLQLFTLWCY